MTGNAVQLHSGVVEPLLNFSGALEEFSTLKHVVGRLRATGAGAFGIRQEIGQTLGPVLGSFDTRVKTGLGHSGLELVFELEMSRGHASNARLKLKVIRQTRSSAIEIKVLS